MKTNQMLSLFAAVTVVGLTMGMSDADAEVRPVGPQPVMTIMPTFNCGVYFNGAQGMVKITKTNAGTVDKTKDVVATINTPGGKIGASVCGSAFTAVGSSGGVSFNNPPTPDKSYIYTCTAAVSNQTFACNPPK